MYRLILPTVFITMIFSYFMMIICGLTHGLESESQRWLILGNACFIVLFVLFIYSQVSSNV
jgi:hypothetical protein